LVRGTTNSVNVYRQTGVTRMLTDDQNTTKTTDSVSAVKNVLISF